MFTRSCASAEDQGEYFCRVYNTAGETLSQPAQVIIDRHAGGNAECAAPENIHTHPMEGQWKFQGGGGISKAKINKGCMGLNWNFQRGGWIQTKTPSMGGVWIFSGTTQYYVNSLLER